MTRKVAKIRTTIMLDEDLMRLLKDRAARQGKGDSDVIEESLRRDLGLEALERLWSKSTVNEKEAVQLAVEAHHSTRKRREDAEMEQRISLVTLGVKDLAKARAFYEALGWRTGQQPDDEIAFYQAGGMVFGLWTKLGGHGAPGIELAHNVRSPEEVDALLAEAERAGGTIRRPGARQFWGGYSGAFADPDDYVWEVAHNPDWVLGDDGSVRLP
jgi:predicted lactoylglutathione lyase